MKELRCVLVGYGNMGKNWRDVLAKKDTIKVVSVVDVLERNRQQATIDFGLTLDQTDGDLESSVTRFHPDFIIDCSAPQAHESNTMTALQHGCDVLGEKPIAATLSGAKKVVDYTKYKQKVYMVNQNYRWRPIMTILKKYLKDEPLGKIQTINIVYAQNFEFKDTFRYQISSPLLQDMSVHHFDLVRSITGTDFETVYCVESNPSNSKFKEGSSASAVFKLSNGIVFTYQGSWGEESQNTSFMGNWRIACEHGTILWNGSDNPIVEQVVNGDVTSTELRIPDSMIVKSDNIFLYELETSLDRFVEVLGTNENPETWCGDNIHTLGMVLGAIESARKNSIISADQVR